MLADITDDNLNPCVEAGVALAAGRLVGLVSRDLKPRRPPFMPRPCQPHAYADGVEQTGVVHKVIRPCRRRVINAEL